MLKGLLMLVLLVGCQPAKENSLLREWETKNDKIKVLCTTQMVCDVAKAVGGEHVQAIALIVGQLDPHTYELVKGDDEKLAAADVIFYNGLGLEHGPSLHHFLHTTPKAIGVGDAVNPSQILHIDGQLDPHIWLDISLWAETISPIVSQLSRVDPSHAAYYEQRGSALRALFLERHEQVRTLLQAVPADKRYLVTSHDAFNYFTRAYLASSSETQYSQWKERFVAPEGLAPEGQLGLLDIQQIVDHLLRYRITVIFPESNMNKDSLKKIVDAARKQGLDVSIVKETLYADAMGPAGTPGDNYPGMVEWDAKVIAQHLSQEEIGIEH